jgi:hypothetical protein
LTRFCTYFDGRYAPRALVMLRSLAEVLPEAEVWILPLDARAAALEARAPRGTHFVPLDQMGGANGPERGRLMALKPAWLAHVLVQVPPGEPLTYVDADMFFLDSPREALAEAAAHAVTLSLQRFTDPRGDVFWGRFNAGWIGLRNDEAARAFLDDWRRDCEGRMSPTYSNQKFLEQAAGRPGVGVLGHPGVNVAHWNVAGVPLAEREGRVIADGRPLVAYHMAGLFRLGFGRCDTSVPGRVLDGVLRERVYEPYLRRLREAAGDLGVRPRDALDRVDWPQGLRDRCARAAASWLSWVRGGAVRF